MTQTPGAEPLANALADALAAAHAAIYAYGPVGVVLDDELAELARQSEHRHRELRDQLIVLLAGRDAAAPPAAPAYELPFPVGDAEAAMELAVLVEDRVAGVWRAALGQVELGDRELALAALVDAAVWATRWRLVAGVQPPTLAFPGE